MMESRARSKEWFQDLVAANAGLVDMTWYTQGKLELIEQVKRFDPKLGELYDQLKASEDAVSQYCAKKLEKQ